jgi:oligopeptide/dipeptide ABC transporter ATP-binding protein
MTVAKIVTEPINAHKTLRGKDRIYRAVDLIEQCGLFADQIYRYPHQFSGGQRQRICIARALAAEPDFIACDEAVSSLDVSIQAQVINLLLDLKDSHNLTYMFITHDLNVVRFISDEIVVMYLGQVVEKAPKEKLFGNPRHPYTVALLNSIPEFGASAQKERHILEGDVPSPVDLPSGCRFHTRCPNVRPICSEQAPELKVFDDVHFARCHFSG